MRRIEAGIILALLAALAITGFMLRHELKLNGAQDCQVQTIADANTGNEQVRQAQADEYARTIRQQRAQIAMLQAAVDKAQAFDAKRKAAKAAEAARRQDALKSKAVQDWWHQPVPAALLRSVREPASDHAHAAGEADEMAPVPDPGDLHPPL